MIKTPSLYLLSSQVFPGLRSWILGSVTLPILTNDRYFGAVIHQLLNFFSRQNLQNLMRETPSLYDFSSQVFPGLRSWMLSSMTLPIVPNNR